MTTSLLKLVADLELSLAAAVSVGATTATLTSASDSDGVALPIGLYGFTIDGDNSAKEFIVCNLNSTALTNIISISMQGASSAGFANYHRVGATVTITDWAILSRILNNLVGATGFDSATPLLYDAEPSYSNPLTIPTVQYVLDTVNGGAVTFNRQIISGDAGENVSAGDWIYYNTTDGEWYLTDADDTTKCLNVQIGKAIGAGTNGNPISGGIFVSGNETVGTYVAGTIYYLSNTAGALATSAGTNSVIVGVGDGNGDLILNRPTPSQTNAMTGDSATLPSTSNTYMTKYSTRFGVRKMTAGATINGATLPVPVYQNKTDNEFYACDANDTAALKFTGFAISNGTDGTTMDVQFNGVVTGFSALDEGEKYYVQDAIGTIGTTIGTREVLVGIAISPTELLIQKGLLRDAGSSLLVASTNGSTVVTCGFRPSVIRMQAYGAASTTTGSWMSAVWTNGVLIGANLYFDSTPTVETATGATLTTDTSNPDRFTFTVGSVTDTGFTITWTESGVGPEGVLIWDAEGSL